MCLVRLVRSERCRWAILSLALLLAPSGVRGAFLRNVPQPLVQPDGTVVHLFATGDEYYNWLHDADGYVVVRDPASGWLVYATKADGLLHPGQLVVGRSDPRTAGLPKGLKPDRRFVPEPRTLFPAPTVARALSLPGAAASPFLNNIVVFIRFADEPEFTTPASSYEEKFNSTASGASSLRAFFGEASYKQLTVTSTFYPIPADGRVVSYRDSQPRSYYRPYDATTNPNGYDKNSDTERARREHTLLANAVEAIAALVPTSLTVDADGDGTVDNVCFIVSGTPVQGDWGNLLWPHRWFMSAQFPVNARINGKLVDVYNLQLDDVLGVGVLCHEMAHTLGAPDLYHYGDLWRNLAPVGKWDLMGATTEPPEHMGAYVKYRYLGWIPSIPQITSSGSYTVQPLVSGTGNCYRIASPNSTSEYFVVEYRRRTGPYESSVPGSGLLVYRINTAADDGSGNRNGPPDEVYIYRPGGSPTSNGDPDNAHLGADVLRPAISDSTDPAAFLSAGGPGGLSISNIGAAGETITFTVNLNGSGTGACTTSIAPVSQSFGAAGGTGTVVVAVSSGGTCTWTATSNATWIAVTGGASGTGNGTVTYSVSANTGGARTGSLTVAGQTFTVTQSGAGPVLAFSRWIGAVSHVDGKGGSHWRTDVAALNPSPSSTVVEYRLYTPAGVSTQRVDLAAGAQDLRHDVAAWLGFDSGSCPLEVRASETIVVMARTYNQVDAVHTFGQDYEGKDPDGDLLGAGQWAWLPLLAQTVDFRCNIAITNTGSTPATVMLALFDGQGGQLWSGADESTAIPPGGFIQYLKPFTKYAGRNDIAGGYAKVTVLAGSRVMAWASVVDENTGDPTTIFMKR